MQESGAEQHAACQTLQETTGSEEIGPELYMSPSIDSIESSRLDSFSKGTRSEAR